MTRSFREMCMLSKKHGFLKPCFFGTAPRTVRPSTPTGAALGSDAVPARWDGLGVGSRGRCGAPSAYVSRLCEHSLQSTSAAAALCAMAFHCASLAAL